MVTETDEAGIYKHSTCISSSIFVQFRSWSQVLQQHFDIVI